MEQRVLNTRTVKTIGSNGLESFTTVVLDSLHYESHLICTNCGPLGLKGDSGAVDQPRGALGPLVGAHRALERGPRRRATSSSTCRRARTTSSSRSTGTACAPASWPTCSSSSSTSPRAGPTSRYAHMLCNKWYEILWTEYNLPRPSKRKKIKLRMMLELFATESAVFEKFMHARVGRRLSGHAPRRRTATCRPFASSSWWTSCAACSAAWTTR